MLGKRKSRELAVQILFAWDTNGARDEELARQVAQDVAAEHGLDPQAQQEAIDAARAAWDNREASDTWVERLAPQWPPRRQPAVDRNIIRLAVYELTSGSVPPKVAIDEAIELAKGFSTENSPSFVNGVLDGVLREHVAMVSDKGAGPSDEATKGKEEETQRLRDEETT